MTRKIPTAIALTMMLGLANAAGERDPALAGYFAVPLQIATRAGDQHAFVAYLAVTPQQRAHGLMYVRELPADHGMLFLYKPEQYASMWMKNTFIPLDMLFIRADGTISSIVSDTVPGSLVSIRSEEPVMGVLELNAGTAGKLNIAAGDRILYRAFGHREAAGD